MLPMPGWFRWVCCCRDAVLQENPLPESSTTASSPIFSGYRPARAARFAEDQSMRAV
jgi:hypothetical protein